MGWGSAGTDACAELDAYAGGASVFAGNLPCYAVLHTHCGQVGCYLLQIIVQVTQKGYRPPIPPDFPPPLADLARQCWAEDPHARCVILHLSRCLHS